MLNTCSNSFVPCANQLVCLNFLTFSSFQQVPSRHLDMAIEQLPRQISPSPFSSHNNTPYASPSHYATPTSARMAVKKRVRYAKIDIDLYDNPRLKSYKGLAGESERPEGEGLGEESREHREHHKDLKARKYLPHEKLLLFVGQEWKDLVVEVRGTMKNTFPILQWNL